MSGFLNINDANNEGKWCCYVGGHWWSCGNQRELKKWRNPTYIDIWLTVLSTSKGFEALHNVVLDIHGQLLCYDVGMEVGHMYDELQWLLETFQCIVSKLTLNVKRKKKSCICRKWLYMTCLNNKVWTLIFVKKIVHLIGLRT